MVDRVVLDAPTVLQARAVDNRSKAKIMDQDMSDHNLQVVTDQNVQLVTDQNAQNAQVVTDQNAQLEAEMAREEEVEDPTNEISEWRDTNMEGAYLRLIRLLFELSAN